MPETTEENPRHIDPQLFDYLDAAEDQTCKPHLEYLLESVARPIVHRIVERSIRSKSFWIKHQLDSQDLVSETLLRILARLKASKADPEHYSISSFDGLVAIISYRVISDHIRRGNRHRTNLTRKVRRLIKTNHQIAIWEDNFELVCGYASWQVDESSSLNQNPPLSQSHLFSIVDDLKQSANRRNMSGLILLILQKVHRPIRLKDLVGLIDDILNNNGLVYSRANRTNAAAVSDESSEVRPLLDRLFAEIKSLELEQRKALLLNMTDSYGYSIEWFVFTGISTEKELAKLLAMTVDEFKRLLPSLPMTDKEISVELGISPVRVANIRKAVRERLERRRKTFFKENRS